MTVGNFFLCIWRRGDGVKSFLLGWMEGLKNEVHICKLVLRDATLGGSVSYFVNLFGVRRGEGGGSAFN